MDWQYKNSFSTGYSRIWSNSTILLSPKITLKIFWRCTWRSFNMFIGQGIQWSSTHCNRIWFLIKTFLHFITGRSLIQIWKWWKKLLTIKSNDCEEQWQSAPGSLNFEQKRPQRALFVKTFVCKHTKRAPLTEIRKWHAVQYGFECGISMEFTHTHNLDEKSLFGHIHT